MEQNRAAPACDELALAFAFVPAAPGTPAPPFALAAASARAPLLLALASSLAAAGAPLAFVPLCAAAAADGDSDGPLARLPLEAPAGALADALNAPRAAVLHVRALLAHSAGFGCGAGLPARGALDARALEGAAARAFASSARQAAALRGLPPPTAQACKAAWRAASSRALAPPPPREPAPPRSADAGAVAVRFLLLLPAAPSALPLPPDDAAGYPAEPPRVALHVAVLARALLPRRSLRAAAWALARELGLAEAWRARGGIEAVLHGVSAGASSAPPEAEDEGGIEAGAEPSEGPAAAGPGAAAEEGAGDGADAAADVDATLMLRAGVGALAAELAHEDGFLYVALRAPRARGE